MKIETMYKGLDSFGGRKGKKIAVIMEEKQKRKGNGDEGTRTRQQQKKRTQYYQSKKPILWKI